MHSIIFFYPGDRVLVKAGHQKGKTMRVNGMSTINQGKVHLTGPRYGCYVLEAKNLELIPKKEEK